MAPPPDASGLRVPAPAGSPRALAALTALALGLAALALFAAVFLGPPPLLLAAPVLGAGLLALALAWPAPSRLEAAGLVAVLIASLSALGAGDRAASALQVVFGVLMAGYLAAWYGVTLVGGRRVVRDGADLALLAFLAVGVVFWIPLGLTQGAWGVDLRSDLTCVLALALFFPARETVVRARRGPELLAGVLIGLGAFAAFSSGLTLHRALTGAAELHEVVDVRASSGEIQIIGGLLLAVFHAATTRHRGLRVLLAVVAAGLLGGLVLSKSRGPWLTAALGLVVGVALLPAGTRTRALAAFVGTAAGLVAVAWAALGGRLLLIGVGLLRRFTSISTAARQDISLLNRYAESEATWAAILQSPVLGYGWGVPVVRFDWTVERTYEWAFVHNGYLWLWHRTGLIGLALFAFVLAATLGRGAQAARRPGAGRAHRVSAAAATGSLVAFLLLVLPSNPFAVLDQMLVVALTLALLSGLAHRPRPAAAP